MPVPLRRDTSLLTMTMNASPSHWTDARGHHTTLSQLQSEKDALGQSIPIMSPIAYKTSNSPNYSDRISPPINSPSNLIHPSNPAGYFPTLERSIGNHFYVLSQNYPKSEQFLHTQPHQGHSTMMAELFNSRTGVFQPKSCITQDIFYYTILIMRQDT
jgi:hypothetical protein